MANPFDQFDAQEANPFDQFDQPTAKGPSVEVVSVDGKEPSAMSEIKSGTRSVVEGAAGLPLALGDALNTLANYGIMGVNKATGKEIPYLSMPSDELGKLFEAGGFEENTGISGDIQRGAAGAMTFPAAGAIAKPTGAIGKAVQSSIAAQPTTQIISGATGGAATGITREAGGGPVAQMTAGLAGSMAPVAIGQTPSLAKRIIRGPQDASKISENISTFRQAGTEPTVGQATQRRGAQAAESFLSRSPGSAGVISEAATKQADDLARTMEEIAGRSGGRVDVGRSIKKGAEKFAEGFKEKSRELYDEVDNIVNPSQEIGVKNTLSTLSKLTSRIRGAKQTSEEFINPKLSRIRGNIIADTGETIAKRRANVQNTLADIKEVQGEIDTLTRKMIDQAAAEETISGKLGTKMTGGKRTSLVIDELKAKKTALSQVLKEELPQMLRNDLEELSKGRQLPYRALKELRTRVGYLLDSSDLVSDIPKSEIKQLYGAISRDIEQGLPEEALPLISRANNYYKAGRSRMDVLENIMSNKTYEKIYSAAIGEAKEGPTLINKVLRSMPDETRKKMAHEFLRTMGKSTAGQQSAAGDIFSTETFLTNWNKIDPRAKSALFSNIDPKYAKSLDAISKVAENIRTGSKVFRNVSGTQQAISLEQTIGGAMVLLLTGNIGPAAATAIEPAVAYGAAKWMTNPNIVNWLAQNSRRPVETLPITINALSKRYKDNEDVQDFVDFVKENQEPKP
jgi:hypothetical protein